MKVCLWHIWSNWSASCGEPAWSRGRAACGVYGVLEGEVAPVDCTAEDYLPGSCAREPVCLSRGIWSRVQAAILGVLDSTTLDDLLITEALQHHFVPLESIKTQGEFAHA